MYTHMHIYMASISFERSVQILWHYSFICATWLIYERHDSFMRQMTQVWQTWLMHERHDLFSRDMTHLSYLVWHDSFTRVTWLIHMCDMTHSHVWHDSSECVTFISLTCHVTHWNVRRDSFSLGLLVAEGHKRAFPLSELWEWNGFKISWTSQMCPSIPAYIDINQNLNVYMYKLTW